MILLTTFFIVAILIHLFLINHLMEIKHKSKLARLYLILNIIGGVFSLSCLCMSLLPDSEYITLFEYAHQILLQLLSPTTLLLCLTYYNDNIVLKKYRYFYVLPIVSVFLIITNTMHNLYFTEITVTTYNLTTINFTLIAYISIIVAYIAQIVGIAILIKIIIDKEKTTDKSLLLAAILFSLPIISGLLTTFNILPKDLSYMYISPVLYTINIILFTILTLKPKFLDIRALTLEYALDNMSQGYMILDQNGNILKTNKTFDKLILPYFNLTENSNIYSDLAYNNSHLIKKFNDLQHKIAEKNIDEIKTHFYFKAKERKMEYELEIHKLKYDRNKNIANIFLFKDMTEHRENFETIRTQKMLMYTQDQLSTIGILAKSFANDISTSLTTIDKGIHYLNKRNIFSEDEKNLLVQMQSCVNKITDISNNVTTSFAVKDSDKKYTFNICETVPEIQNIVASELKKYNTTLEINIFKAPIHLYGSKVKFNQIITNIVINAIQAYDKNIGGKVIININKDHKNAIIEIIDNAGGIDSKISEKLFKNIFTTKGKVGTGLGLHFSNTLIRGEFNGEINFVSKNGGTTFTVKVPYKKD